MPNFDSVSSCASKIIAKNQFPEGNPRLATSGPHELLSERSGVFRPQSGQANDEVSRRLF